MKKHLDINNNKTNELVRMNVPDSEDLQQRILEKTKILVQENVEQENHRLFISMHQKFLSSLKARTDKWFSVQPVALASLAIVTAIVVSLMLISTTITPLVSNELINPYTEEFDPMDQLAWEDLWLMQDELAFANL